MDLTPELIESATSEEWRDDADCLHIPRGEADWFPGPGQAHDPKVIRAKEVCAGCPVHDQCLVWGLFMVSANEGGIYGGLTARERRALRSELRQERSIGALRDCVRCHSRFSAPMQTSREKALCPTCRETRPQLWDRTHGRSGTLARAKYKARRGMELTEAQQAVMDKLVVGMTESAEV